MNQKYDDDFCEETDEQLDYEYDADDEYDALSDDYELAYRYENDIDNESDYGNEYDNGLPDDDTYSAVYNYERIHEIRQRRMAERQNRKLQRKRKRIIATVSAITSVLTIACIAVSVWVVFLKDDKQVDIAVDSGVSTVIDVGSVTSDASNSTPDNTTDVPEEKVPEEKTGFARYSSLAYSDEELTERYDAYSALNPSYSVEEVVWRVNANLDKPKYEYDIPASDSSDPLIIVNKYYTVPDGFEPPDLQSFDGYLMRRETGEAYKRMRSDAAAEGYSIRAVSAYRSVEYQRNLYNSYLANDSRESVDRYSARPGHSEHHTGMAIDLFGSVDGLRQFESTPEYPWVRDNAYKYGFIIRYTQTGEEITGYEFEPWHIRYVGVDVSTQMRQENIETYEEYYAKYLYKANK